MSIPPLRLCFLCAFLTWLRSAGRVRENLIAIPECVPDDDKNHDGAQATPTEFLGAPSCYQGPEKVVHVFVLLNVLNNRAMVWRSAVSSRSLFCNVVTLN